MCISFYFCASSGHCDFSWSWVSSSASQPSQAWFCVPHSTLLPDTGTCIAVAILLPFIYLLVFAVAIFVNYIFVWLSGCPFPARPSPCRCWMSCCQKDDSALLWARQFKCLYDHLLMRNSFRQYFIHISFHTTIGDSMLALPTASTQDKSLDAYFLDGQRVLRQF